MQEEFISTKNQKKSNPTALTRLFSKWCNKLFYPTSILIKVTITDDELVLCGVDNNYKEKTVTIPLEGIIAITEHCIPISLTKNVLQKEIKYESYFGQIRYCSIPPCFLDTKHEQERFDKTLSEVCKNSSKRC